MSDDALTLDALAGMHCTPGPQKLEPADIARHVALLPGWEDRGDHLEKTFRFPDYHATIAFVNALAWIAHREDHHPDLGVHYNRCVVAFGTHSAGGITLNDCISAARVERLTA